MSIHPQPDEFQITIRDESFPRKDVVELLLKLSSQKLTAGQLIAERVRAECDQRLLNKEGKHAPSLITPSEQEQALNGPSQRRLINPDRQVNTALAAFETNGFILLIDDWQVEDLEAEVTITEETVVTFLKLTPLVGG